MCDKYLVVFFFVFFQSEIDRDLKDVKEQREQLYRKLEVLRAQGIELGPNLSGKNYFFKCFVLSPKICIFKTEPSGK